MKNQKWISLLMVLCLILTMLPLSAAAAGTVSGTCGNEVRWTLTEDGMLTISGEGEMYSYYDMPYNRVPWFNYRAQVTGITVEEGVTAIGNYAFYECSNAVTLSLPEGLTRIGVFAFYQCKGLDEIVLPESLEVIDDAAFCGTVFTEITISAGVTALNESVFESNFNLKHIWVDENNPYLSNDASGVLFNKDKTTLLFCPQGYEGHYEIPDGVTELASTSFTFCDKLTGVSIPGTVANMGEYTFMGCFALKDVTLGEGITTITNEIFSFCETIEEFTIPASVTAIESGAFSACHALSNIYFEGNAPTISSYAFAAVVDATAYYPAGNATWTEDIMQDYGGNLTWKASGTTVVAEGTCGENLTWTLDSEGTLTISGTGPMTDYEDPMGEEMTFLPPWTDYSGEIKKVVVNEGVTTIGDCAFNFCPNVTEVTLPNGITSIGTVAFGITSITQIELPETLTSIGAGAFRDTDLTSLEIPDSVTSIGSNVVQMCGDLTMIKLPKGLTKIEEYAFTQCGITSIEIPEGVTSIGDYAFYWCGSLKSITLPSTLTEIGYLAFESAGLESLTIPGSVKTIGSKAFWNCSELTEVTFNEGVETIGYASFMQCRNLKNVTIPASVKAISGDAFSDNAEGAKYYFAGSAPEMGSMMNAGTGYEWFCEIARRTVGTAYYPEGDESWTEEVKAKGGENLTWVAYEVEEEPEQIETTPMYRLYNPNSGEHFYTGSVVERDTLIAAGWAYEGIAWNAPTNSGDPVYRLFNPNNGDHHYTMSAEERDMLVGVGWQYEGVAWNSASPDNLPLYRLFNPNADCGNHHYTGSTEERDFLVSVGWIYEGIGWFGMLK